MDNGNVAPISAFLAKKWVKVVLVLDVILIVGLVIFGVVQSGRNVIIDFEVTPLNAEITLNGRGGYANGEYKIFPGEYQVRITHEGLEPKELTVNVGANDYVTVATFLRGEDGFSYYELMENYSDYESLEAMASKGDNQTYDGDTSAEGFISDMERVLSISEILPIKGYVYADPEVSYSTGGFAIRDAADREKCERIACLLVNYYGIGYEAAVMEKIREAGYAPADYQIVYERYSDV